MGKVLCVTFRFLHPVPVFHGRADKGVSEWPPSPMRVFQALVGAASSRSKSGGVGEEVSAALDYIEPRRAIIVAPTAVQSTAGYRAYVPHNQADLVSAAWARGNKKASIAQHRVEKDYRPMRIEVHGDELPALHYLYTLDSVADGGDSLVSALRPVARAVSALGWGIDQVAGDAVLLEESEATALVGHRWREAGSGGKRLRSHRVGSRRGLAFRYDRFMNRISDGRFAPVPPLTVFDRVPYRRDDDPVPKPCVVFRLLDTEDNVYRFPQRQLIHVAGMVRHRAIEVMKRYPPSSVANPDEWVERYVAGHRQAAGPNGESSEGQLSYVPLPSVGHYHADPSVRRVMIVAPVGDEDILGHMGEILDGLQLRPERGNELRASVFLQRVRNDTMGDLYTRSSNRWASVTPVILPGHDDHRPAKTSKLIAKALMQSGITSKCSYEWSPFSRFPKSLTAHKYDRDKRMTGYIRPNHLLHRTAIHLVIKFEDEAEVQGPLILGAGRHCGLGLLAPVDE